MKSEIQERPRTSVGLAIGTLLLLAVATMLLYVGSVIVLNAIVTQGGGAAWLVAVGYELAALVLPIVTAVLVRRRRKWPTSNVLILAAGLSACVSLVLSPFGLAVLSM